MTPDQPTPAPKPTPSRRRLLRLLAAVGAVAILGGLVFSFLARRSALSPDDGPEKTYQKIFDAYGGQKALDRWQCGRLKYDSTITFPGRPPIESTAEVTFQQPGKMRYYSRETVDGHSKASTIGSNGKVDWFSHDGSLDVRAAGGTLGYVEQSDYLRLYHPVVILRHGENLSVQGIEPRPDGGRDLVVLVNASTPEMRTCQVDMRTKLLRVAFVTFTTPQTGEVLPGRYEYSDYQHTDGGPVPGRITSYFGERKARESRFVSVEFKEDFEPIEFDPPDQEPGR